MGNFLKIEELRKGGAGEEKCRAGQGKVEFTIEIVRADERSVVFLVPDILWFP